MAYKTVGKAVPRLEGAEKVTGQTRYAADIDVPDALWAKLLRSPLPHARILKVDSSQATQLPGVHAVSSGADIPLVLTGLRMKDMPVLARDRVRYVGEPVAAVAAVSSEIAEEALNLIDVQYEELPFVTDPLAAIRPGAPLLHDNPAAYKNAPERSTELPNVQSLGQWSKGDVEAGLQKATRVFEHTFRTPLGFHAYIEPHACMVRIDERSQIEVWASNKSPFTLRDRLARDLNLDAKNIRVHILPVGGDFGGKTSVIEAPICYFLAERAGKPVKLVLNYAEDLAAAPHRHPAVITLRTGVARDGRLCALQAKVIFSGGAYAALKANAEVTVQGPRRVAVYERPSGAGRSGAAITIESDGRVTVLVGVPDVGPGIHTVVQQIVSEVLEVKRERVNVRVEDTDSSPYDSGTGGSKSTNSVGHAGYQAASEIKEKIIALAAARIGCKPEDIKAEKGRYITPGRKRISFDELMRLAVEENQSPITHLSVYEPSRAAITSFAAQVAEVEVDPATGQVKVKKLTTVHDAGRVLNRLTYQGQVDGGVVTGLGFALMEDNLVVDGKIATANLGEFKIPSAADVPKLTTLLMESPTGPVPFQGKAIGEIPNVPTAAAVANAIADAVGVRIFDLPLTSEKIHAELSKR